MGALATPQVDDGKDGVLKRNVEDSGNLLHKKGSRCTFHMESREQSKNGK